MRKEAKEGRTYVVALVVVVGFGTEAGREQGKGAPTFLSPQTPVSCR